MIKYNINYFPHNLTVDPRIAILLLHLLNGKHIW